MSRVGSGDAGPSPAVELFERPAADARNLDLHVHLVCQASLSHEDVARRFWARARDVLADVGVSFFPANASELVRLMNLAIVAPGRAATSGRDARPAVWIISARSGLAAGLDRRGIEPGPLRLLHKRGAALGAGALVFAGWSALLGIGQWRDTSMARERRPVPALVVASEAVGTGKGSGLARKLLLEFRPAPNAAPCRASVQVGFLHDPVQPGASLRVVPRSPACAPPLLPGSIGDPLGSFLLAAGFLAGGVWLLRPKDKSAGPLPRRHAASA